MPLQFQHARSISSFVMRVVLFMFSAQSIAFSSGVGERITGLRLGMLHDGKPFVGVVRPSPLFLTGGRTELQVGTVFKTVEDLFENVVCPELGVETEFATVELLLENVGSPELGVETEFATVELLLENVGSPELGVETEFRGRRILATAAKTNGSSWGCHCDVGVLPIFLKSDCASSKARMLASCDDVALRVDWSSLWVRRLSLVDRLGDRDRRRGDRERLRRFGEFRRFGDGDRRR
jgi:hypothetical protein